MQNKYAQRLFRHTYVSIPEHLHSTVRCAPNKSLRAKTKVVDKKQIRMHNSKNTKILFGSNFSPPLHQAMTKAALLRCEKKKKKSYTYDADKAGALDVTAQHRAQPSLQNCCCLPRTLRASAHHGRMPSPRQLALRRPWFCLVMALSKQS